MQQKLSNSDQSKERDLKYLAGDLSNMSFANLQKVDYHNYAKKEGESMKSSSKSWSVVPKA